MILILRPVIGVSICEIVWIDAQERIMREKKRTAISWTKW